MNPLNICPSTLQRGYNTYSPLAQKILFDGQAVSHIFSEPSPDSDAKETAEKLYSELSDEDKVKAHNMADEYIIKYGKAILN